MLKRKIVIPIEQKALRAGCALAQVELCRKRLCSARQSVFRLIGNVYSRECAEHTLFLYYRKYRVALKCKIVIPIERKALQRRFVANLKIMDEVFHIRGQVFILMINKIICSC